MPYNPSTTLNGATVCLRERERESRRKTDRMEHKTYSNLPRPLLRTKQEAGEDFRGESEAEVKFISKHIHPLILHPVPNLFIIQPTSGEVARLTAG